MAKKYEVEQRWHGGRGLLNLEGHETTGAIVAELEDTRHWHEGRNRHGDKIETYAEQPSSTLAISDCSRSVQLSTYIHGEGDFKNLCYKLDTMIDTLQGFRDGLEIEWPLYKKRLKLAEKNEKKERKN